MRPGETKEAVCARRLRAAPSGPLSVATVTTTTMPLPHLRHGLFHRPAAGTRRVARHPRRAPVAARVRAGAVTGYASGYFVCTIGTEPSGTTVRFFALDSASMYFCRSTFSDRDELRMSFASASPWALMRFVSASTFAVSCSVTFSPACGSGGFLLKNPSGFSIDRLSPHALWFARFMSRATR